MKCYGSFNYWSKYLNEVVLALNMTPEEVSKLTPYQIMFKELPDPYGRDDYPVMENNMKLNNREINVQRKRVIKARHLQYERNKKYFDKHHKKVDLIVGDKVKVTNLAYEVEVNKSFKQKFTGPWIVRERVGSVSYKLQLENSPVIRIFHVSRIRKYFSR
jgi:hypothetical protein